MARPNTLNGGAKAPFPRHVGNGLLDIRALRQHIERAEGIIAVWTAKRDELQKALDVRLGLLQSDVEGHEVVVSGNSTPLCRVYTCTDPSCKMIDFLAAKIEAEREFPLPAA